MIGRFRFDPVRVREIGLTLWVTMEPIPPAGPSGVTPIRMGAILDTGSAVCGVNLATADRLIAARRTERRIYTPTLRVRVEPALRCRITFEDGASRELDFSVINELEPYEVLIGRDLMSEMKLDVNFSTGDWTLDWA
jgi:hypothetical protein